MDRDIFNLLNKFFEDGFSTQSFFNENSNFPQENDPNFNKTITESQTDSHLIKEETWTSLDGNFIISTFRSVYLKLINADLKNIIFNITNDSSVFFKSSHNEDHIFIELFFDNEIPVGYELMVNIHKDNGANVSFGGSAEKVVDKLKNELVSKNIKNIVQFEQTRINEELSGTYFAKSILR